MNVIKNEGFLSLLMGWGRFFDGNISHIPLPNQYYSLFPGVKPNQIYYSVMAVRVLSGLLEWATFFAISWISTPWMYGLTEKSSVFDLYSA